MPENTQPIEKPDYSSSIDIFEVFPTIQGEGPYTGMPAVFVRLAGCTLMCPACDTLYTGPQRTLHSVEEAVDVVAAIRPSGLVVLTGGEPLRQRVGPFVQQLLDSGYTVQIETNGTLPIWAAGFRYLADRNFHIVCSPKSPTIHKEARENSHSFKYVIQAGHVDPEDGLPTTCMGGMDKPVARPNPVTPVWVQPMDEKDESLNEANRQAAVEVCLKYGYRLSLQTHKLLGLP